MDSSNKEGSKNDLCYPLLEHPKIECFDNSIRFLELELKREFPKGKLAQYFFFFSFGSFPTTSNQDYYQIQPSTNDFTYTYIAPKSYSLSTSETILFLKLRFFSK